MGKNVQIDWSQCALTEMIPGKQGGVPLIVGTRIPAQQIVEEYELGSEIGEIAENYPSITVNRIQSLLDYAKLHKMQPVP
jgi:uncharacterized protein (DUF433 family)